MSEHYDDKNERFLCFSPPVVLWHQITSFSIGEPFNGNHLHLLFPQMTNLRTLDLRYRLYLDGTCGLKEETLIDLPNDSFLCNMLMANGLRQLNLFFAWEQPNLLNIAYSIVERLPHLEVVELHGIVRELVEVAHILINGLSKLSVLILGGEFINAKFYDAKLRDLMNSNTRSFRTELFDRPTGSELLVWL